MSNPLTTASGTRAAAAAGTDDGPLAVLGLTVAVAGGTALATALAIPAAAVAETRAVGDAGDAGGPGPRESATPIRPASRATAPRVSPILRRSSPGEPDAPPEPAPADPPSADLLPRRIEYSSVGVGNPDPVT